MDANKTLQVTEFRQYLDEHNIEYKEKVNGHFQIFVDCELRYQVWATTEKLVEQDGPTVVGMSRIHKILETHAGNEPPHGNVRSQFEADLASLTYDNKVPSCLVAVIKLPTGALEVITNNNMIDSKIEYYLDKYDEQFRLKANPSISIAAIIVL